MTTQLSFRGSERSRRRTAASAFVALAAALAAVVVAAPEDVADQVALQERLDRTGAQMLVAWALWTASGSAWLCLAAGLRRVLPSGGARDLWLGAVTAAQAATCVGASLVTAASNPRAHDIPLPAYEAFQGAGHHVLAAGTVLTGLALLGLAVALRSAPEQLPRWFRSFTTAAGVVLVPASIAGPVAVPVVALWLLVLGLVLLRGPAASPTAGERRADRVA
ncbi:hypothetical protein ACI797_26510 [Geodermatophilus sp. SYSU D00691]